jgi:hypothetical protein
MMGGLMNRAPKLLFLAILICVFGMDADAQSESVNTSVAKPEESKTAAKKWSLLFSTGTQSNLYATGSADHESSSVLTVSPTYLLNEKQSLNLKLEISQEHAPSENTRMSNTVVTFNTKGQDLGPDIKTNYLIRGTLPSDQTLKSESSFQGGLGAGGGLSYQIHKTNLKYGLLINRNIHEFTQNNQGSPNIEYQLAHSFTVVQALSSPLSFVALFNYRQARTYKGFQRQAFLTDLALEYSLNSQTSFNLGISNEGPATKANGKDNNIEFYNQNTSVIYGGLSISI